MANKTDFFNACAYVETRVNLICGPFFIKSALKRPDMLGSGCLQLWEIMPDMFIEAKAIIVVDKNFSGSTSTPNHKLAYFMEDIGINSHHWHWHIVNAFQFAQRHCGQKGLKFFITCIMECWQGFFPTQRSSFKYEAEILSIIRSWADRVIEAIDAGFAIQEGGAGLI
ncbi:Phenoloxidase subunit 1 [Orchesella cincta]|uniref:Phenoloxidase subunit 1 n=1 Tax=Orchesella cincta TaxID=48709 RepID=A0A1D2MTF4_ORCCI|nr:Phenoloxidase subunit 1 [Orchesella cincta]